MKLKRIAFYRAIDKYSGEPAVDIDLEALRYDNAFVIPDEPSEKLQAIGGVRGSAVSIKEAVIAFSCFQTKGGVLGGAPTLRKWESHGIKLTTLIESDPDRAKRIERMQSTEAAVWTCFRHPRSKNGPMDYSRHVPVTFRTYLDAKDTDELDPVVQETNT